MNYNRHYNLLIEKAKSRERIVHAYYENHHILPKSLGGTRRKDNMVMLTAKEHYVAHHLLVKIYNNVEMIRAFFLMCKKVTNPDQNRNYVVTASVYNTSKEAFSKIHSERMSGENNPNYKKSMSDEQKLSIGMSNKGKRTGMKATDETKKLQSLSHIGRIRGPNTKVDKRTGIPTGISPANKGKPSPLKGFPRGTKFKDIL